MIRRTSAHDSSRAAANERQASDARAGGRADARADARAMHEEADERQTSNG